MLHEWDQNGYAARMLFSKAQMLSYGYPDAQLGIPRCFLMDIWMTRACIVDTRVTLDVRGPGQAREPIMVPFFFLVEPPSSQLN